MFSITFILIAFFAGFLTVLAPCVLPLLPVIVGGSVVSGKVDTKKACRVIGSLSVSVLLFTILLKASTALIGVPVFVWQYISGGILVCVGLVFLFPLIWENQFFASLSTKANRVLGVGTQKKSALGDYIVGLSLGPVFTTCSPTYFIVLATVLPVSFILGVVYLCVYIFGLATSLFVVVHIGQRVVDRFSTVFKTGSLVRKIIGVLFVLVGVSVGTGYDKVFETYLVRSGYFNISSIEQYVLDKVLIR